MRAIDLDPQYQSGLPVSVLISVTYHDDKPVKVTDATKQIVLIKIPNNKDLSETYIKQELSMNGTAKFNVKTSSNDESGFILKVSGANAGQSNDVARSAVIRPTHYSHFNSSR